MFYMKNMILANIYIEMSDNYEFMRIYLGLSPCFNSILMVEGLYLYNLPSYINGFSVYLRIVGSFL